MNAKLKLLSLLPLVAFVSAQDTDDTADDTSGDTDTSGLPECVGLCQELSVKSVSCDAPPFTCFCSDTFSAAYTPCIQQNCSTADATVALAGREGVCNGGNTTNASATNGGIPVAAQVVWPMVAGLLSSIAIAL